MKLQVIFWVLCIPGALLPLSAFAPWFLIHGLDMPLFIAELFSTRIGAFFGWDVIVSAIVLTVFILVEGKKTSVKFRWLAIVATFGVGVSLGLPLFLALRERALNAESNAQLG